MSSVASQRFMRRRSSQSADRQERRPEQGGEQRGHEERHERAREGHDAHDDDAHADEQPAREAELAQPGGRDEGSRAARPAVPARRGEPAPPTAPLLGGRRRGRVRCGRVVMPEDAHAGHAYCTARAKQERHAAADGRKSRPPPLPPVADRALVHAEGARGQPGADHREQGQPAHAAEHDAPVGVLPPAPSRPACTAQFTGLYWATPCIHPGMSACAMNTDERKASGSSTKLLTAIIVSSRRDSRAMALESAPMAVPSSTAHTVSATSPAMPPGYVAPDDQAEHDDDRRLDDAHDARPG